MPIFFIAITRTVHLQGGEANLEVMCTITGNKPLAQSRSTLSIISLLIASFYFVGCVKFSIGWLYPRWLSILFVFCSVATFPPQMI